MTMSETATATAETTETTTTTATDTAAADTAAATEAAKDAGAKAGETKATDTTTTTAAATDTKGAKDTTAAVQLKLPENAVLDPAVLERISALREKGLSDEAMQAALDFVNTEAATYATSKLDAMKPGGAEWQKVQAQWKADTLADEKLGKTAEERQAAVDTVGQFLRTVAAKDADVAAAGEEFLAAGLGNHPLAARFLYGLAKMTGEGKVHQSGTHGTTPSEADRLAKLYPTMHTSQ